MNRDALARNLAEVVDELYRVTRDKPRRLELIAQQIRRAWNMGYRCGKIGGAPCGRDPEACADNTDNAGTEL